jgi:glycosyltransferase involved in cell wall biosynthesis
MVNHQISPTDLFPGIKRISGRRNNIRVALCVNAMTPYRLPLYRLLAKTPSWDFRVFYDQKAEKTRQWSLSGLDFNHKKIPGLSFVRKYIQQGNPGFVEKRVIHFPFALPVALAGFRPDIVIGYEMGFRTFMASMHKRLAGIPLVIWSGVTPYSERNIPLFKKLFRKGMAGHADSWLAYSTEAKEYIVSLGGPGENVFICYNSVDNDFFAARSMKAKENITEFRKKLNLNGLVFLYVGSLVKRKGIDRLLDAWEKIPQEDRKKATLLLVGSGEEKDILVKTCADRNFSEVAFLPHVQQSDLPAVYAAADILVFPTVEDIWGLVVNEAMACGLPVLVSRFAGCARDLVVNEKTGVFFDPDDIADLSEKMRAVLNGKYSLEDMGKAAKERASRFTIEAMAWQFRLAVDAALGGK